MANLSQIKREQMIAFLEKLKSQHDDDESLIAFNQIEKELTSKKYGLVWEEHEEEVDEKMKSNIPVFIENKDKMIISNDSDSMCNFLLEGDNLHSLKLLEKTHKESIDVIYIDPPYNRGKDDFVYNDDYMDSEDSYFHSKWISFMEKRLKIAFKLLQPSGVIFISIDDNEVADLRLLCDSIFSEKNFLGHIHWRRRSNQPNDKTKLIGLVAEHILAYTKDLAALKKLGIGKIDVTGKFSNPDNDPKGPWASKPWKVGAGQSGTTYTITTPTGIDYTEAWMGTEENFKSLLSDGRILFPNNGKGSPRKKYYLSERTEEGQCATNWWEWELFGSNNNATDELKLWFDDICPFDNPKPTKLIENIIQLGCVKDDALVLDFFAGSGTTAEAVLNLNHADGGSRRFILCTNNEINGEQTVKYLHANGEMLNYEPGKKTKQSTIFKAIEKYFEERKERYRELFEIRNEELQKYGICQAITYPRIQCCISGKTCSGKYVREPYESNLKYYKTDFVSKDADELTEELLNHINEMIQLQYGMNLNGGKIILIMDDDEMDSFEKNYSSYCDIQAVFINQDVLLTASQEQLLANVETFIIPDYYFDFELREAGELW